MIKMALAILVGLTAYVAYNAPALADEGQARQCRCWANGYMAWQRGKPTRAQRLADGCKGIYTKEAWVAGADAAKFKTQRSKGDYCGKFAGKPKRPTSNKKACDCYLLGKWVGRTGAGHGPIADKNKCPISFAGSRTGFSDGTTDARANSNLNKRRHCG